MYSRARKLKLTSYLDGEIVKLLRILDHPRVDGFDGVREGGQFERVSLASYLRADYGLMFVLRSFLRYDRMTKAQGRCRYHYRTSKGARYANRKVIGT